MLSGSIDPQIAVPPLPPLHVPRPRLLSALNEWRESPLTLLSAGPGSGKTVLLTDWAHQWDRPVAWLTVTPADNEPRRFWRLLLSAVRAGGASEEDLPPSLVGEEATVLLESLFTRIPASAAPLALVIDDAHVLTNPHVLDGIDSLLRGQQAHLRLVLAARSDPLLPLHRYRLSRQMHELRAADLMMTRPEARALLAAHGVMLPDDAFDALAARIEGWTAGIRLSAIRMAGTDRPADFVAEFAVNQGSIGEYLMNEVISRQPLRTRLLLMRTGFLGEVSGPLADAITSTDGSADVLVDLARSNSFVTPLDPAQTRFRYHPLLAEILQHLVRQQTPSLVPTLYRRAATWYGNSGDLRNALKWAAKAGDGSRAASLLARGGLARAYVHRQDMPDCAPLLDLFREAPSNADDAEVRTAQAAVTAIVADGETAAQELVHAHVTDSALTDPDLLATAELAELILAEKAGDTQIADATADRLLDVGRRTRQLPGLRACVLLSQARAKFWDGRNDEVEPLLEEALAATELDGIKAVELEVVSMSALVNAFLSRHGRAERAAQRARELRQADSSLSAPLTLDLAVAFRAFVQGDFAGMAGAIQRAAGQNAVEWDSATAMLLTIVRAQMLLGCGQFNEARMSLQTMPELGSGAPAMLAVYRDMLLARIETVLGRPHGALRLLERHRGTRFAVPTAVPSARAYLALGELDHAQDCIRRVLTGATAQLGRCMLIEAVLCDAEIAQLNDDSGRALEMLVRAVELADGDIILPFVRAADVFTSLLRRHPAVAARWPAAPTCDVTDVAAEIRTLGATPLLEPLTDREQAVLRLLATSMSIAEIADELYVSVNTIKTHLAAIYRKLAARRRREAVLRAREFELL